SGLSACCAVRFALFFEAHGRPRYPPSFPTRRSSDLLDRSSSMSRDDRLGGAVRALLSVVDRLDPVDRFGVVVFSDQARVLAPARSEEHTSELQSRENLVCRLLLEKKKNTVACKHKVD